MATDWPAATLAIRWTGGNRGWQLSSEKQPAGHESFLFSIQWRRFDANKKWEMGAGKEEKNKVRTTKRVEKEEEEEARGTAGKLGSSGESLTLRRAAPGPGRSGAAAEAAAAGGSRCLQQPSTPGFSSFFSPIPIPTNSASNKGLGADLKGSLGGNSREQGAGEQRGMWGTCAAAEAWMQQHLCEMGNFEETGGVGGGGGGC